MEQDKEVACIVTGCPAVAVCFDSQNYTKWRVGESPPFDSNEVPLDDEEREIWYCREHAIQYLFPLIDHEFGNTTADIVEEFKRDGMWR